MKGIAVFALATASALLPGVSAADAWKSENGHRYIRTWDDERGDRGRHRGNDCRVVREYKKHGHYKVVRECKPHRKVRRDDYRYDYRHDYRHQHHRDRDYRYRDERPLIVIEPIIRIGGW